MKTKIGIIMCDRYRTCAGGKCFKAMREHVGAFDMYDNKDDLELVSFATCGGCPGGNIKYAPEEMKNNGTEIIHLATGFIVGYPPCSYINHFMKFIPEKFGVRIVVETHPIPQKYFAAHQNLESWNSEGWEKMIEPTLADENIRLTYN